MRTRRWKSRGFTLIELSIALVIIGLIIGGILVGQEMVSAAYMRAQIAQIEKYNSAVNTFRTKYNAIPGDIQATQAAQFGFVARAGTQARGDGNGLIEGFNYDCFCFQNLPYQGGETLFFWEDLSSAGLIDQVFNTDADVEQGGFPVAQSVPEAKIGNGNFVSAYSSNGVNYFALSGITQIEPSGDTHVTLLLSVKQAYALDTKTDDGLPTSGKVQANYPNKVTYTLLVAATNLPSPNSSTCYDTTSKQYSMTQNGGAYPNCALSFVMQGAAR